MLNTFIGVVSAGAVVVTMALSFGWGMEAARDEIARSCDRLTATLINGTAYECRRIPGPEEK